MAITVTPLHPHIGAEIRGVDLDRPVPPDVFATIDAAFNRHAVLVFPRQPLGDEQQIAFSRLFGPLETSPEYAGSKKSRLPHREIADISNLDPDGRVMSAEDKRLLFNRGNQLWHTDSSFKYVPARCSLLSAREIPPAGGETEFADLRAAYDALPEERRRALEGLVAEPQFVYQHRWRVGDLVIWDDRCTMHRGRRYDDTKYRRDMHRTTVSDEVNSVERERPRGTAA